MKDEFIAVDGVPDDHRLERPFFREDFLPLLPKPAFANPVAPFGKFVHDAPRGINSNE